MNESKDSDWPSYVIDSDVLIDHLRGYQQALDFIDSLFLDGAEVCFSVISEAEIYSNVRSGEKPAVWALFDSLTRLDVSGETARKAGEYRAQYLRSHGGECLGRLIIEPRRLWRRYLVGNPLFLYRVLKQRLGLLRF